MRRDDILLVDMLLAARRALEFLSAVSPADFEAGTMRQFAVMKVGTTRYGRDVLWCDWRRIDPAVKTSNLTPGILQTSRHDAGRCPRGRTRRT